MEQVLLRKLILAIFLVFSFLSPLLGRSVPVLIFSGTGVSLSNSNQAGLSEYALIRDHSRQLDRDQVAILLDAGLFTLHKQNVLDNYGFTQDVLWMAFRAKNLSNQASSSFLEVQENNLKNVQVYVQRTLSPTVSVWSRERSGSELPLDKRPIPVSSLLFNGTLPPHSESLFIIRIDNFGPNRIHIDLLPAPRIFAEQENQNVFLISYLGAMGTLMLYNILLFIAIRDRSFIWFVIHLLSLAFYVFAASGYGFKYLWAFSPGFQALSAPFFTCCILLTTVFFVRQFIETFHYFPRFDRLLRILAFAVILSPLLMVFNYRLGMVIGEMLLVLAVGGTVGVSVRSAMQRHPNGRILVIALAFLFGGAILRQLTTFGVIGSGWPLVILSHADYPGIFLAALVLSVALSHKLQELRLQKEDAEAKNRLKQSFIANVSHEMRTPLNAIIGFSESIQDMKDPELMRRFNLRILAESERLLFQINQVLDIAKLEADHLSIDIGPFSLQDSLAYIDSVFRSQAEAKGLELTVYEVDFPGCLLGDRLRIEQVLRNLVDNAIKFTEVGKISILAHGTALADGIVQVIIKVCDTGIGIPADKQAEIFEEFVQADSSITRRFGGTGLGTSISRKLVAAMGGTLSLQSKPGEGSTFSFNLNLPVSDTPPLSPVVPPAENRRPMDSAVSNEPELSVDSDQNTDRPRILVVDDFETNRQVVCIHLSRLSVDVDSASNGPEALDLLFRRHYDLVLLDLFMPGLSGHDVVRIIRERWDDQELPVLGLTASGVEEDISGAMASGMNGVMVKPVKRLDLIAHIRQFLPAL